jgi:hypothetical protein
MRAIAQTTETIAREESRAGRGRDFLMPFEEKEGTTAIVRRLHKFPQVDVIRARGEWEPFDRHACGPMSLDTLTECLELIFSGASADAINDVYRRTATRSLSRFDPRRSVGFKMRFKHEGTRQPEFKEAMIEVLAQHNVLVLMAVRQDLLRWALSKYHGDGTGRPGHLQFQLASGALNRGDIPRISVDPAALERTIGRCRETHVAKRRLASDLRAAGLHVVPVRYEDFLADETAFFRDLLSRLGHEPTERDMQEALSSDIGVQRVHGDDLSEYFVNAEELEARFGDRFEAWP